VRADPSGYSSPRSLTRPSRTAAEDRHLARQRCDGSASYEAHLGQTDRSALAIGKAKDWQGDETNAAEVVYESQLGPWLENHAQAVVGATVYSILKKFAELPPFDLVVIDEASQVRVPETAVPSAWWENKGDWCWPAITGNCRRSLSVPTRCSPG